MNALMHADYSQRGAPIRIAFLDDRIDGVWPRSALQDPNVGARVEAVGRDVAGPVVGRIPPAGRRLPAVAGSPVDEQSLAATGGAA